MNKNVSTSRTAVAHCWRPEPAVEGGPRPGWRYPFQPLHTAITFATGRPVALLEMARQLGVHNGQIHRWIGDGMTERAADKYATLAGFHPSEVWGCDWFDVVDLMEFERSMARHPSNYSGGDRAA